MTRRELVERTFVGRETGRIPLYDLLRNDVAFEYFSAEKLPRLSEAEDTVRELDRIAGKAAGALLDMTRSVGFGPPVKKEVNDEYGFGWQTAPYEKTTWITRRPFADESGGIEFLKKWISRVREDTETIRQNPNTHRAKYHKAFLNTQSSLGDTVNLLAQHGVGLDDIRHRLGLELFCYIEADVPGLISEAMEVGAERNIAECHAIADKSLSPAVLTYGDIACKERLMHSPDFLRREFFPRLKRLNNAWHEHGFKCLFHSDGYLMEVMDDLIESGIDGLNPIETVAGMSLRQLREKYGHRLFLAGGIDMSQLLSNGTPDEVREVCCQAIHDAYPGYFMGSTTEIDNSCRLANIIVMYTVAQENIPG